jgi:hypothetical protein
MVPVVICGSGRAELVELLLTHGWQRNHRRDGVESADGKVALKGWGKRKVPWQEMDIVMKQRRRRF